ncbi:glycosyltransferase [Bradyrhizobium sp. SYSU BS000235]|uniref:glycosyltransferase n=1 Tax=Bradyrhizobium sp. SYSU BS000235 TaxID=3411332 RepID=UPI003C76FBD2
MSRSLLAISWAMPPALFPRSLQVARSMKALAELGWRSTVICAEPPPDVTVDPALQRRYESSFRTIRLSPHGSEPKPRRLWDRLRTQPAVDPDAQWISAATEAGLREAHAGPFEALISFAQPWSDHLVGMRIATQTRLPWVAHFSDPWADSPFLKDEGQRRQALEAEADIVERADIVVFTVDRIANLVMRKYPSQWGDKVRVVPHGFESHSVSSRRRDETPRPLRLVHAGDFYGIRTPAFLIAALQAIHKRAPLDGKLEVILVGSVPDDQQAVVRATGLDRVVQFSGRIANAECDAILETADALLLVDAPAAESVFLPSKLIDYLPFDRPIIGITPPDGASADLLRSLGCPTAAPDDVSAIAAVIERLLEQWQAGTLRTEKSFTTVASQYHITQTTALLDRAITDAVRAKELSCGH